MEKDSGVIADHILNRSQPLDAVTKKSKPYSGHQDVCHMLDNRGDNYSSLLSTDEA